MDDPPPALFANGWGTVKVGYTALLSPKYYSRVGSLLLHAGVSRFSLRGTTAETFYGSTFDASVRGVAAQLAASYQYRFGTGRVRPFIEVGSVTSFALSHNYSINEDVSDTVRDKVGPFRWQGTALGLLGSVGLERPPFSAALRLYWQPRRVVFANENTPQLRSLFLSFSYEL